MVDKINPNPLEVSMDKNGQFTIANHSTDPSITLTVGAKLYITLYYGYEKEKAKKIFNCAFDLITDSMIISFGPHKEFEFWAENIHFDPCGDTYSVYIEGTVKGGIV